jgi:fatty-acyl-CoA synthase
VHGAARRADDVHRRAGARTSTFDLSTLRTGIMAGAPCPIELMNQVIEKMNMKDILIGYGQTEASPITNMTRPDDTVERRSPPSGASCPHQEQKVVDPDDRQDRAPTASRARSASAATTS